MYTFELIKHVSHWLYLGVESIVTLTDCSLMSVFLISDYFKAEVLFSFHLSCIHSTYAAYTYSLY